ncbi:MAG: hypothetical protein E7L17_10045 [Clostridium sp.]|uniref:hypothetical protein n=1 Tax=Clostridium sp. TaxID=1506 RepID=UPI00290631CE|nr:hypothetical protein [Clostridium sp.]MDU7338440.1 hypothetical protein [Clostridium sp.]
MRRAAFVRRMLRQYGSNVTVTAENTEPKTVYALIQAMNYKNKVSPKEVWMPEGYFDNSHFSYIGPPECRLDQMRGAVLSCSENNYQVIRAQSVEVGNQILYLWAVLKELPGEETDGGF